jgi:hypothetical protein
MWLFSALLVDIVETEGKRRRSPVIAPVDRLGAVAGQMADIEPGVTVLADAVFGQPAWVLGVIDKTALFDQDKVDTAVKVAHARDPRQ